MDYIIEVIISKLRNITLRSGIVGNDEMKFFLMKQRRILYKLIQLNDMSTESIIIIDIYMDLLLELELDNGIQYLLIVLCILYHKLYEDDRYSNYFYSHLTGISEQQLCLLEILILSKIPLYVSYETLQIRKNEFMI